MGQLTFRAVDRETWSDFAALFEARGGPKFCWCMVWRATPAEVKLRDGASRRSQMHSRVEGGVPVGLLGYDEGRPVAWCSIAPRDTYQRLGSIPQAAPNEQVWSIACFFVKRDHRGQGVVPELIEAAIAHARMQGATIIEAYPVAPDSPSYRFMGRTDVFLNAGFHEVGVAGKRRHIMRLILANNAFADDNPADPIGSA